MVNILELIKRLKFRYPLFITTIEQLDFYEDYGITTAATDGKGVYYNPKFMLNLTPQQQLFVLAHEVSHVALNHLNRLNGRDIKIWNIATDAVINAFLVRDGLIPAPDVIFIDNALSYSSDELYKMLEEERVEYPNMESVQGDKEQSNQSHQRWGDGDKDSDLDSNDEDNNSGNSPKKNKDKNNQQDNETSGSEKDDQKQDETSNDAGKSNGNDEIDERQVFDENMKKRKENEKNLRKSIKGEGFSLGDPGFDSPNIKVSNIGKKSNIIDWRRLLKEACKLELDYSYKDAQIEDGVLVSHLIEISSCETEILLDTSGSIDHNLLKAFLKECKNILQNSKIKVACFDDRVYKFVDIRTETDLEKMKFKGGGGTNFETAVKGFTNRVDNKIIFTDGYGYVTNPPLDIIWVVFESAKNLPKEAKVIKVDRKKLLLNNK
jgi:predicted metal-dependent peptidase